jgi:uncharacterized HAD superfamily protein
MALFPPVIILKSDQIEEGVSGAPVLDIDANRVIGIISDHYNTYYQTNEIYKTLSLGIPIDSIIQIYPELNRTNKLIIRASRKLLQSTSN